ncbi:MAG TPA: glycosyltransferase family 9 protein [Candidatus Binataceae bacterium]|nr:glycosyltransferase family 9 protein [Candidatus Binataceae bacterium]
MPAAGSFFSPDPRFARDGCADIIVREGYATLARMNEPATIPHPPLAAPPRRVLIVLHGAIGDVVRALPLLGRMRRGWPGAFIAWAVEPKSAPILERHPWLDEVIVFDRPRAPWSAVPFVRKLRAGHFDLAVDLQRHLKSGITALASGAPARIGFAPANAKEFNHRFSTLQIAPQPNLRLKLIQYQAFGDRLGLARAPIEFGLEASAQERARARELLGGAPAPILGVILGSSWPSRIYFPESIAAAIAELARSADGSAPIFPVLLGGADESELAAEVMRRLGDIHALNLTGRTRLRDLIAIFPECAAAFGPDSGPMHIAAAMRCPVVSLWGATAPERSAPWGYAQFAIAGEIPCHPCYLRECPIGRECMRRIEPGAVAAAVRRAIGASPAESADAGEWGLAGQLETEAPR